MSSKPHSSVLFPEHRLIKTCLVKDHIITAKALGQIELGRVGCNETIPVPATVKALHILPVVKYGQQFLVISLPKLAQHDKKMHMQAADQLRRDAFKIVATNWIEFKTVKPVFG